MPIEAPGRPFFSEEFRAAARTYPVDAISSAFLFFCACVMAGRIWRFPFDDEVFTLVLAERHPSALELMRFILAGGEISPPLSYLLFHALFHMGWSEAAMRLCSVAMTALSLVPVQLLTLGIISRRSGSPVGTSTRLIAVLLFGLSPLAIGQGDAIRWYPLFALLFALFLTLYLAGANRAARLASAVPLGLAASTSFVAAIVIAPFLLYRHVLERRFRLSFDAPYWLVFAVFASPGIYTAFSIAKNRMGAVAVAQFGAGPARAVATNILGFFGGNAVGITQAWIIVPVVAITGLALLREIDRKHPANPVHLLLLTFVAVALMVLPGFGKPRSFLYLAPVLAAILTLFLDRCSTKSPTALTVLATSLILAASVATIATIEHGTRPFKRNAAIPFEQILDFIRTNEKGNVLIVSSDSVLVWELRRADGKEHRCVSRFAVNPACFLPDRHYDSIFVISGQSDRSSHAGFIARFEAKLAEVTAGRRKVAEMHAGVDRDAALKSRLTKVPLDAFLLSVQLYE